MNLLTTALGKLKEKSTWAGIAALTAAAGWKLDPDQWSAIAAVVIAAVGVWEVFRKDR
jgi:threonine/homoserine efflux transporter RhtA